MFHLALVTGANGGLGQALVRKLKQENISVIPFTRADCDLLNPQPLLDIIAERTPDLVINNAGFTFYGDALSHPQSDILQVNAAAVHEITLAAARALKAKKRPGVILNVSSAASLFSFPGMATYVASKAFVNSFSRSFDAEIRPFGIRILTSLPGPIATPFASKAAKKTLLPKKISMSPDRAAALIWQQILSKKPYQIIDWRTRWLIRFAHLIPNHILEKYLYHEILSRIDVN